MSGLGKNGNTLEKTDIGFENKPRLSSSAFMFAHEAAGGELIIDLENLTTPTDYAAEGFTNLSAAEISEMNLTIFKKRLKLISSLNGELIQYDTYKVISPTQISLIGAYSTEGLDEGEIIVGHLEKIEIATLPDARMKQRTYIMTAGQTLIPLGLTYNVGEGLELGLNIGDIKVFRQGKLIYRNTGNATADPSEDGGYEESGPAAITLNIPAVAGEIIMVELGCVAPSGDAEFQSALENLHGAVTRLAQDAAEGFHGDEDLSRYLNVNPSEADRVTFGDLLLDLFNRFDTTQKLSEYTKTKWQKKTMTTNNTPSQMNFNNLVPGRTYRLRAQAYVYGDVTVGDVTMIASHDGNEVLQITTLEQNPYWHPSGIIAGSSGLFTATATTITFTKTGGGGNLYAGASDTFAILEELPNHEETTDFT